MSRLRRFSLCVLLGSCLLGAGACTPADERPSLMVTTELTARWRLLPHRISNLELGFQPAPDGRRGTMFAQNAGGPFGSVDMAFARQAFSLHQSPALRWAEGSVTVEIPPTGNVDPEAFTASAEARIDAAGFADGPALAWLRGYRISSDEYASPPSFATDAEHPYDPAFGFTTQGMGIALGTPRREGSEWHVPVRVRNSLGTADRADLNAAIPAARSWVRVDLLVVSADVQSATSTASVAYTLSTTTYGKNSEHPRASESEQRFSIAGRPGLRGALVGLKSFDLWLNVPGRIDPACTVTQDELNFEGDPISGPGRYMTELGVRIWDQRYDARAGQADGKLDLFFSNRSVVKEIGNLCLGLRGELSMLQMDAELSSAFPPPQEHILPPGGGRTEIEIELGD